MTNFIEFRKEYLEENPGSSMTIIRNAYYKSVGKEKPIKGGAKKKRKSRRKLSQKRKSSRKVSRKKKSRKSSKKRASKRRASNRKSQSGGYKDTDIFSITKSMSTSIKNKTDEVYKDDTIESRSDIIEIANVIQDQSLNANNINKINEKINLHDYEKTFKKLNTYFKKNLSNLDKLSTKTAKKCNKNLQAIESIDVNNINEIKKIKENIQTTSDDTQNLFELSQKLGSIMNFIESELD